MINPEAIVKRCHEELFFSYRFAKHKYSLQMMPSDPVLSRFVHRTFNYQEDYYWKSSCRQLCKKHDGRACNQHSCPINCLLTDFGAWSDCSPCAKKQARKHAEPCRTLQNPDMFLEPRLHSMYCSQDMECSV